MRGGGEVEREVGRKWLQTHLNQPSFGHWHGDRHVQIVSTLLGKRSGVNFPLQISPKSFQIDAQSQSQHVFCRMRISDLEQLSPMSFVNALSRRRRCILTMKTHGFSKILTFSQLSLWLIISSRGVFNKGFKIGIRDVT